jgi:uncharacterized protein (TIGR02588 family)
MSNGSGTDQGQDTTGNPPGTARSAAEWTTLAISAAVLVGIVGLILWLAYRTDDLPPTITVEANLEQIREESSGYYVPITIRNDGDATVQDAIISGELDTGSGQPESAEVTISFLASHEEVSATLVFRSDPTTGDFSAAVTSYKEP